VVHLKPVDIGRDYGNVVELVNGVTADDQVIINPPDSLTDGQTVKIAPQPKGGATESQGGEGPDKTKAEGKSDKKDSGQTKPESSSSSPGQAPEKQSAAPDKGGSGGDQGKSGSQPASGMTAPGSDGNSQK
jgi:hypothetical protein